MTDDALLALYQFQSTLSSRRATRYRDQNHLARGISIHALLTESDLRHTFLFRVPRNFNPRSPHGERPYAKLATLYTIKFQSTLSSRRATRRRYHSQPAT